MILTELPTHLLVQPKALRPSIDATVMDLLVRPEAHLEPYVMPTILTWITTEEDAPIPISLFDPSVTMQILIFNGI